MWWKVLILIIIVLAVWGNISINREARRKAAQKYLDENRRANFDEDDE
jgi:hypothetical protein